MNLLAHSHSGTTPPWRCTPWRVICPLRVRLRVADHLRPRTDAKQMREEPSQRTSPATNARVRPACKGSLTPRATQGFFPACREKQQTTLMTCFDSAARPDPTDIRSPGTPGPPPVRSDPPWLPAAAARGSRGRSRARSPWRGCALSVVVVVRIGDGNEKRCCFSSVEDGRAITAEGDALFCSCA